MRAPLPHICALSLIILIQFAAAAYLPLPSPIQCNSTGCTVEYYQRIWVDRKPCRASRAIYPTSEAEIFEAVALASKTGSKIKVVSKGAHSIPKLVCPGGEEGLLISTKYYNSLIHVNLTSLTVTAHAGVMLRALVGRIAEYGLAIPHTPVWQGISVAGMISTGSHGSSMWDKGSHPHDYVVGMRLIVPASEEEGYAKVIDLGEADEDLDAARLSLGVLGAISTVTFQLERMFKRSVRFEIRGDEKLEGDILQFAKDHEFGEISWYPASGKALFKVDNRVGVLDTEADGAYHNAVLKKLDVHYIESLRSVTEAAEESQSLGDLCGEEARVMKSRQSMGDGLVNFGNTFTGYPVVGFNNKVQTSGGCEEEESLAPVITPTGIELNSPHEQNTHREDNPFSEQGIPLIENNNLQTCMWNPLIKGFFFFDTSISIPSSKCKDAILELKKLRDLNPKPFCSFAYIGGIWIRFLTASKAYLAQSTHSVVFEFMYYRAKDPFTPRLHQDLFEEMEQMLVNKFGGKPHWGKNRDLVFGNMHTRTRALGTFLEVRQRFDPSGLFSNEWTDAVLGIQSSSPRGVQVFQDHCALEGLCVCQEDSHCHPTKGYFCRLGHVYKEAHVCRYENQDSSI